jgi:hypothetical protein
MKLCLISAFVFCILIGGLSFTAYGQLVFVDPGWPAVCVDSITWVDVLVDSMVDSLHSYACLMYVDTSKVLLDSVIQGAILDSIYGEHDTVWFGWEYDEHFPDSLYFGASIFGAGAFVNGPGQLARILLTGKREGVVPVQFGWCILRDPWHPSGPGMEITTQDGQIIVLGHGIRYGDVNADGMVEAGDVVYLINYLYRYGAAPLPWWFVGDANCDHEVDGADVVYIINYLFRNGPLPCYPCGES